MFWSYFRISEKALLIDVNASVAIWITTFEQFSIATAGVAYSLVSRVWIFCSLWLSLTIIQANFSNCLVSGINVKVHSKLNTECTIAMPITPIWLAKKSKWINILRTSKTVSQIIVPPMLKHRWTTAALLAPLFAPIEEISAVTQVPMFWPIIIGMAEPNVIWPVELRACRIPTDADELWITAVRIAPANTPRTGFVNINRMSWNSGTSLSGATASLIDSIPNIRTAKPRRIWPISLLLLLFRNI